MFQQMHQPTVTSSLSSSFCQDCNDVNSTSSTSYSVPLNNKTVLTACSSSTINLDSLLSSLDCSAEDRVNVDKLSLSVTTEKTSACTSLAASSSLSSFSSFSSARRTKGRMTRSARFSNNLSSLSESLESGSRKENISPSITSPGTKRARNDVNEVDAWGYFVDYNSDFDIDASTGAIARVLDDDAWGYFADIVE